jgi:hypothetical protein
MLKRFCNHYSQDPISLDDVKKRSEPTFGIVVYDLNETSSLQTAIDSIMAVNYDRSKIKVVINSNHTERAGYLFNTINTLVAVGFHAELALSLVETDVDREGFSKCYGYSYLVKMNHYSQINPDLFSKINHSLNEELERVVMFQSGGVTAIPFNVVNTNYLDYNNFDNMTAALKDTAIQSNMYRNYE